VATRTQVAADDFATSISASWTQGEGDTGTLSWASGGIIQSSATGNQQDRIRRNTGSYGNDQYSAITVTNANSSNGCGLGVFTRAQASATDETSYFGGWFSPVYGQGKLFIVETNSSFGETILASTGTGGIAAGSTIVLENEGTALRLYTNEGAGETLRTSTTDATITSGWPGICTWADSNVTDAQITDWAGGNLTSATLEQEGFRWRDDDGNESGASWLASQDSNLSRAISTNTRLRVLVNATDDPASAQYRLEYKLSTDPVYRAVEAAGGGAIAFGAVGTVTTSGTTAPTVAYPSGIAAGNLLILAIANRPNASTPSTPSGWAAPANNSVTGGAGSEGAGTGVVRMTVFVKEATGTESGSLSLSIASGTSCGAVMWRVSRGSGKDWRVALANGADNSAGTGWSAAFGSDPGVTSGDLVFVASAASEDTASFASQALSQTGVTYGSMTERADSAITTGNDLRLVVTEHPVSSGTSSAAATYTMTASGTGSTNTAGASVMIRLRQADAPIQLAASGNIASGGANTTAQLTAPSGKSTSDFVAGRIQDDENPADAVNITSNDYTELEWCVTATAAASVSDVYQFRVTSGGTALDSYTVTPQWTIDGGTPDPGAMSGSSNMGFSPSGTVTGTGRLIGSVEF
jgi:hypothetical protein